MAHPLVPEGELCGVLSDEGLAGTLATSGRQALNPFDAVGGDGARRVLGHWPVLQGSVRERWAPLSLVTDRDSRKRHGICLADAGLNKGLRQILSAQKDRQN